MVWHQEGGGRVGPGIVDFFSGFNFTIASVVWILTAMINHVFTSSLFKWMFLFSFYTSS